VTVVFLSAAALLLLDQSSKKAAQLLPPDRSCSNAHFVRIHFVANVNRIYKSRSIRIGMALAWFWAMASVVLLSQFGPWFQGQVSQIGLGLALGGAAGNLIDIWRRQSVVDFIDLGWWPAFNFADVGIVAGLLLAFWP
jgi:lipoprotein signal peptidase